MSALFGRFLERRDTTYQQVWGSDSDNPAMDFGGRRVTREKALALSAVFACVRFLTDAISTLPLHVYRKTDDGRIQEPDPDWLEQPVPRDPSTTIVVHLQQVVTSLLLDGNSFTFAAPSVFNPAELRVLDPRKVDIRRGVGGDVLYRILDHNGRPTGEEYDWTNVLHVPLIRLAGELRGIAPIEAERQTFGSALAAEELAGTWLRKGTFMPGTIEAPQGTVLNESQAKDLVDAFMLHNAGSKNAGRPGVLTNGAVWKPISVTPEQAQFLETRQYDDERIFRIFRIFPSLAGMIREGATSNASAVQQALAFEKHTVRPLVSLIETGYQPLVGTGRYLRFNTKGLLRGDPRTQAEIYHYALTDKWRQVDEVRDLEDEPRFGGEAGGFLQTPNNNAPGPTPAQGDPSE